MYAKSIITKIQKYVEQKCNDPIQIIVNYFATFQTLKYEWGGISRHISMASHPSATRPTVSIAAAAVAPPHLPECSPYKFGSKPNNCKSFFKSESAALYDTGLLGLGAFFEVQRGTK